MMILMGVILDFSTLSCTNLQNVTPKRYMYEKHPVTFIWETPGGRYVREGTLEKIMWELKRRVLGQGNNIFLLHCTLRLHCNLTALFAVCVV